MTARGTLEAIGLLILRVGLAGLMIYGHGYQKLVNFSDVAENFGDPFGLGPTVSLGLAVFAEFFCSLLIAFGLVTRLAVIPLVTTMATAALWAHADDPWNVKELAVVYLVGFTALLFTGPGRLSLDALIWGRKKTEQ